jgi:hypothetical protein
MIGNVHITKHEINEFAPATARRLSIHFGRFDIVASIEPLSSLRSGCRSGPEELKRLVQSGK